MPFKRTSRTPWSTAYVGRKGGGTRRLTFRGKRKFRGGRQLSTAASSVSKTTTLKFGKSLITRQPMPDRFFTWFRITNSGTYASNAFAAASFAFSLDQIIFPFNFIGGSANGLPNPQIALNVASCSGAKDLLYNTNTGSGIYQRFRPWRVKTKVNMLSENASDCLQAAMAPIVGTINTYSNSNAIAQAPNSCTIMSTSSGTNTTTALKANWSFPQIYGIPESLYSVDSSKTLAYNSTPNLYCQVGFYNTATGNTKGQIFVTIETEIYVELFQRLDVALYQ